MKNFLFSSIALMFALEAHAAPNNVNGISLFFGKITETSVNAFIAKYDHENDIKELIISSQGGDVKAAIRFANWVQKRSLDVRVRFLCFSACANYIFVAAKNKVLEPGAFVAWHGDVEQKDFRELVKKYDTILEKKGASFITDDEKIFLEEYEIRYESLKYLQQEQSKLYSMLKVNPMFGRIGQEPISYPSDGWTLTKKAMEHFGIKNVSVPDDYATVKYFSKDPTSSLLNGGPLLILDVNSDGEIFSVNLKPGGNTN